MEVVEEKRRSPRVKVHVPVRYFKLREGSQAQGSISVSKNISEGGIRFRTSEFISMAWRLILELDIPVFTNPIKVISKVAWIRKTSSQDEFEIGNQFIEISKEDKELISDYIDNFDASKSPVNYENHEDVYIPGDTDD